MQLNPYVRPVAQVKRLSSLLVPDELLAMVIEQAGNVRLYMYNNDWLASLRMVFPWLSLTLQMYLQSFP